MRQPLTANQIKLIEDHLEYSDRIIRAKAKSRRWPIKNIDDLMSYGRAGLFKAARDFDENKGFDFKAYANRKIIGAAIDGMREDIDLLPNGRRKRLIENGEHIPTMTFSDIDWQTLTREQPAANLIDAKDWWGHWRQRLSPLSVKIIEMYYFENKTTAEIGEVVNMSEFRVWYKMKILFKWIREKEEEKLLKPNLCV